MKESIEISQWNIKGRSAKESRASILRLEKKVRRGCIPSLTASQSFQKVMLPTSLAKDNKMGTQEN